MKKVKPLFPSTHLLVAASFLGISILFFLSPLRDTRMLASAILLGSVGVTMLWFIDHTFLTIEKTTDGINFKGYFSIRKFQLRINEIDGYEIHQKVNQFHGLHEEIQLITKKGKLHFPKIAYGNYDELKELFVPELKFLGHKELKYGRLLGRIIPIMFLVSGILAGLVGLLKLLRW